MDLLERANSELKKGNYKEAIALYQIIKSKYPIFSSMVQFNLDFAMKKIGSSIQSSSGLNSIKSTPVLSSDLYEGRLESNDHGFLKGWSIKKNEPGALFELSIYINDIIFSKIKNDKPRHDLADMGKSLGKGGFSYVIPKEISLEGKGNFKIKYPDGTLFYQIDFDESCKEDICIRPYEIDQALVSIIIPVYNAADDFQLCIDRLLSHTKSNVDVIVIDDASTDPKIREIFNNLSKYKNIRIFRNDKNLGFTRTINRGIGLAGENDVVLLNSDARVTPRWLEGIKTALATDPNIATVTPMSDRAGAFSAPDIGNDNFLPEGVTEEDYAIAFRRRSLGLYPSVPTGNGFCLYIRRACLKQVGLLDPDAFPKGYGEENDFCMRALRKGWRHVIDDRTYVFHERSKSFGEAKSELLKAGREVVDKRYPEYKYAIQVFNTCGKIAMARYKARLAVKDCIQQSPHGFLPRFLFVIASQTGGTPQTNLDLMRALTGVCEGWILRCDSHVLELKKLNATGELELVRTHVLAEPLEPLVHDSLEYNQIVSSWLSEFDFSLIHIRHIAWHSLSLPRIAKGLGMKVIFSFHDYYALSPNLKLIDDKGIFLGTEYLDQGSVYRDSLWQLGMYPAPKGDWLDFWQIRFHKALGYCDAFVTTSESARGLILGVFSTLRNIPFIVIPHGRDFQKFGRVRHRVQGTEKIRILVPGNINEAKGLEIIRLLIKCDQAERLEFYVLGNIRDKAPERGIVKLGSYKREQFLDKASAIRPHIGIVFSIWDETYCHTLTELFSVGLPVAVLNYPNVASRVQSNGLGWVLDHKNISSLYKEIIHIATDNDNYEKINKAIMAWQQGEGLENTVSQMAKSYISLYTEVLSNN